MNEPPPVNLVHVALFEREPDILTSPDGASVQVKLSTIAELLANPPLMLKPWMKP